MSRLWTSSNHCEYINDYVYIIINIPEPIPEPEFDTMIDKLKIDCCNNCIDEKSPWGGRWNIDDDYDLTCEDNPVVTIDGKDYVTYTGFIRVVGYCEHGLAEDLTYDVELTARDFGAKITSVEIDADY